MPRKPQISLSDALPQPKPQGGQPKLAKEMRGRGRKRLTHEYVASEIARAGYVLRSEYQNSHAKLDIECDLGHRYSATWHNFRGGHRCPYCAGSAPLTHEFVASKISREGYTLKSQYKNSSAKLDIECDLGHQYCAPWNDFRGGHRCPYCAGIAPKSNEYVAAEIAKVGYVLRSEYQNSSAKLDIECDLGHRYYAAWRDFRGGHRCPYCAVAAATLSNEYVAAEIAKVGYVLRSEYQNSHARLDIECDLGHRYYAAWDSFRKGTRCPHCADYTYKKHKPGRLYYIRFDFLDGLSLYKIGITSRTIAHRFADEPTPYVVLLDLRYKDGSIPPKEERRILTSHAKDKYKGSNRLVSGNTECFTRDVLKLDATAVQLPLPICGAA